MEDKSTTYKIVVNKIGTVTSVTKNGEPMKQTNVAKDPDFDRGHPTGELLAGCVGLGEVYEEGSEEGGRLRCEFRWGKWW